MFRRELFCCVIAVIIGFSMAQSTYTLFTRTAAATNTAPSKVELITATTGLAAGDALSVQFKWYYTGATPTAAAADDRTVTICCVDSLAASTDPLAAFLKDKCFAAVMQVTAAAAASTTNTKAIIVQGVKTSTNFHPGSFINPAGTAGNDITIASAVVTSAAYGLNAGELAAIGLLTTAPTTINFKCGHKDLAAAGTSGDITTGSVAIDQTNTGTFSITGTGTSTCTTSSSSKSSASIEGFIPVAFLASGLAFLALF